MLNYRFYVFFRSFYEMLQFIVSSTFSSIHNSLRADGKPHSFWTHDGSIIVKRSENSGFMTVKTKADIQKLGGVFTDEEIVDDY